MDRGDPSHVVKLDNDTFIYCHLIAHEYPSLFEKEDIPIRYGTFGEVALHEIVEATGKSMFNLKIGKKKDTEKAVLNEDGTKAYFEGKYNVKSS